MKIQREDVLRVAELAHLELREEEVETYRRQLDSILAYVEKLNELDTAAVQPMAQVQAATEENPALRDDALERSEASEAVLGQAPDARKPYFRVPKVIER